jgi:hypothetical protein
LRARRTPDHDHSQIRPPALPASKMDLDNVREAYDEMLAVAEALEMACGF